MMVTTLWLREGRGHLAIGNFSLTSSTTKISTNGCKTIWHYVRSASNKRRRMRRSGWTLWTRKKWQRKSRTRMRARRSILSQPPRWLSLTSWRDSWISRIHSFRSSKWCRVGRRRVILFPTRLLGSRIMSHRCHRPPLPTLQRVAPWSIVKRTTQGSRSHERASHQTSSAN